MAALWNLPNRPEVAKELPDTTDTVVVLSLVDTVVDTLVDTVIDTESPGNYHLILPLLSYSILNISFF